MNSERRSRRGEWQRTGSRGMALLVSLVLVVLVTLGTSVPLRHEQQRLQREREAELLFIGRQFRAAIASYLAAGGRGARRYPARLEDLLADPRQPHPVRHLRRLYADPFTGKADWLLITEQGAVVGVASRSQREPLKHSGFAPEEADFAQAQTLSQWRFVARLDAAAAGAPGAAPPTPPGGPDGGAVPPAPADQRGATEAPPLPPPGDRSGCLPAYLASLRLCSSGDEAQRRQCRDAAHQSWRRCLGGG